MSIEVVVYGAGGFAREVGWLVDECPGHRAVAFVDDDVRNQSHVLHDCPVLSVTDARRQFPSALVLCAIGSPSAREAVAIEATSAGFGFATAIHPRAEMSRWIDIGEGTVICAGNILTTDIRLGRHVQINLDCTIGHDAVLEDYATLAPGVHVSGYVHIGKRAYVGTGANIINGTKDRPLIIGDDAVVGAGACVTKSVEPATTAVGVPAKPLRRG